MKWFRHDASAHLDAKLQKVRIKYGLEGYGLYFYCLELIAMNVDEKNLTFELEHDSEIIAFNTGIHYERIQEILSYMVKLDLFENNNGMITCYKLAKRLDQSMTSNQHMRNLISQIKKNPSMIKNHDSIMTQSGDNHDGIKEPHDQSRLDHSIVDNNINPAQSGKRITKKSFDQNMVLTEHWKELALEYWKTKSRNDLNPEDEFFKFKNHHISKGTKLADWQSGWTTWYCNAVGFNKPQFNYQPQNNNQSNFLNNTRSMPKAGTEE